MFLKAIIPVCFLATLVNASSNISYLKVSTEFNERVATPGDATEVVLSDPTSVPDLKNLKKVDASKSLATKVILHTRFLQKAAELNTLTLEVNANQEVVLKADQGDSVFNLINPREQVYQAFLGQNGSETGLLTIKGSAKKITLE
jgi:hypothetical protein